MDLFHICNETHIKAEVAKVIVIRVNNVAKEILTGRVFFIIVFRRRPIITKVVIGVYIACLVPAMFGLPQRGSFSDILVLLLIYVTDCVFFATAWSSLFRRRETVLVTLLFISPIVMFLTGFSWPATAFPKFWRLFSYIFPTSFACPAFINLNTAGCELSQVGSLLNGLLIQTGAYCLISVLAARISRARVRGAYPSL